MKRIKNIEKVFGCFSFDESPLSIIHVYGKEGKAGLPFVVKPAAPYNCLRGLIIAQQVHDQKKNIAFPSVICIQAEGNTKKQQHTEKLQAFVFTKLFDCTERKISQEQGEKDVLFFIMPGILKHEIPWDF